jgi:hypothetical protein
MLGCFLAVTLAVASMSPPVEAGSRPVTLFLAGDSTLAPKRN